MIRALAVLLALAPPLAAQEAVQAAGAPADEAPASDPQGADAQGIGAQGADAQAVVDPVAAWEADPLAILPPDGIDLDSFEYVARALVVFADSPRQPELIEQLRLIEADRGALAGRDVAVVVDADPEGGGALRRSLRPRGFGLVLVDKDGSVALRQPSPTTAREVARTIDRTPIRREEEQAATRGR